MKRRVQKKATARYFRAVARKQKRYRDRHDRCTLFAFWCAALDAYAGLVDGELRAGIIPTNYWSVFAAPSGVL